MINWILLFISSLSLYFFSKFVVDYSKVSVKDQDAFQTLLETTSNYIAMVDELNCITHISKSLGEFVHIEGPLASGGAACDGPLWTHGAENPAL